MRWVALVLVGGCGFSLDVSPATGDAAPGSDAPPDIAVIDEPPPDPCIAAEIASGGDTSCARMTNGDVWCWGRADRGQTGSAAQIANCSFAACSPTPSKLVLPAAATALGVGTFHACFIADGQTYCTGADTAGQFGDANAGDAATPRLVMQRAGAEAIVGGDSHSCSLAGGEVRCSSSNSFGQAGDSTQLPRSEPVITIASGSVALASGDHHLCSRDGGFAYCWGNNVLGATGASESTFTLMPRIVQNVSVNGSPVVGIAAGENHTCAVLDSGVVRCWGANFAGQLGLGNTSSANGQIITALASGIVAISAGGNHTCGLASGGSVFCWGDGYGVSPTQIALPAIATKLASGKTHDCAVLTDGSVHCVGNNEYGQLGRTTLGARDLTAAPVGVCE